MFGIKVVLGAQCVQGPLKFRECLAVTLLLYTKPVFCTEHILRPGILYVLVYECVE